MRIRRVAADLQLMCHTTLGLGWLTWRRTVDSTGKSISGMNSAIWIGELPANGGMVNNIIQEVL
jgi:hypothetical protein